MTAVPGRSALRALIAAWLALVAPAVWAQAPAQDGASASAAALQLMR